MKKIVLFLFLNFSVLCFSVSYITTAESLSWNGAYASVSEGFEAMLYNPAGIYMTPKKFGINVFGSSSFRIYNNFLTTGDVFQAFRIATGSNNDISEFAKEKVKYLPDGNGFEVGFEISMFNFMFYKKIKNFSISGSMIPKTYLTGNISKSLFSAVFNKLDLSDPFNTKVSATFLQYLDFNFSISTKARFLERMLPFVREIYVGATGHVYIPTAFVNVVGNISVSSGNPNDMGLMLPRVKYNHKINYGGVALSPLTALKSTVPSQISSLFQDDLGGFGLGFDMGFIVVFNNWLKGGFAINDLGFITFPNSVMIETSFDEDVMNVQNKFMNIFDKITPKREAFGWMPATSFRTGVLLTPVKNNYFELLIAGDIAVTDIQRAINGDYATFNIASGIEFAPKSKNNIFKMPVRISFNYNTQSNNFAISHGLGLTLGPVEMEVAIRGFEILFTDWGTKEFCLAYDFKFQFD
ncbi:MAG TPA: DUF5723 family protein [Spirochaetota bacterium]|nr:DUF5723 family protein [Spirochaetota bacterium]